MSTIARLAIFCVVGLAAAVRPAAACSCAMRPACAAFWDADRVFVGRAEVTSMGPGEQRARFRVEESFRGPAGGVVEIVGRGIGGSCAYAFIDGIRYLVFARRAPDGTWASFYCDPTAPVDQAGDSLAFARDIARDSRRGGRVFGSVFSGVAGADRPLSGVTVALTDGRRSFSAGTDSRGQYEFRDVPPGRYQLTVSAPPGVRSIPPAIVDVKGPGACVPHVVLMKPT